MAAFFLSFVPAQAVEYVFVFHDGPAASVYDAETFDLVARPTVGAAAFAAYAAPSLTNPTRLSKIFVVGPDFVTVLRGAPPFEPLGTFTLPHAVNPGDSALITPNGRYFWLHAADLLVAFDGQSESQFGPSILDLGQNITGMTVRPDSQRGYLTLENSDNLVILNAAALPPTRLAGPIMLPAAGRGVWAAPNSAGLFVAQTQKLLFIDPYRNEIAAEIPAGSAAAQRMGFDGDAPLDQGFVANRTSVSVVNLNTLTVDAVVSPSLVLERVVSPRSDLFYLLSADSDQVFRATSMGRNIAVLRNSMRGAPFDQPAVDIALGGARNNFFVAFGDTGNLAKISVGDDQLLDQTVPPDVPRRVSVVSTPGLSPATLEIFGGDGQFAQSGDALPRHLSVVVRDSVGRGVYDQQIDFRPFFGAAVITPMSARTNIFGEANVEVAPISEEEFEIEARLSNNLITRFLVNSDEIGFGGLEAISGNYQIALENTNFPRQTTIRVQTSGVVADDVELTLTPDDPIVTCPATVNTGADGRATFQCSAGPLGSSFPKFIEVEVEDEFGRSLPTPLLFTVASVLSDLPDDPIKESPTSFGGAAGATLEDVIRLRLIKRSGIDSSRSVGFEFTSMPSGVTFSPRVAPTGFDGRTAVDVTLPCTIGSGRITASSNSPGLPEVGFNYSVSPGPATAVLRQQGSGQRGEANQRLPLALVLQTVDDCGNEVSGVPVEWEVSPPDAATLINPGGSTNSQGRTSTSVMLGTRAGRFSVIARTPFDLVTYDLTTEVAASRLVLAGGNGQRIPIGALAQQQLMVDVVDDQGVGAAGVEVTFSIRSGSAQFVGSPTVVSGPAGRASIGLRAGNSLGPLQIEARALGQLILFDLTVVGRTPTVTSLGFVNGASFVPGLVPGSLASIFGVGLMEGVDGVIATQGAPFPTRFRGVRVVINGVEAPILTLVNINGQEQINIQVPFFTTAPSNDVTVILENNGVSSTISGVRSLAAQPGIFEVSVEGGRFAAALHADGSLVEPSNPARPGEVIAVFWTGGGAITPPILTNTPGPSSPLSFTNATPIARLDGVVVDVQASVIAPTLVTVYQANIRVHAAAQSGLLKLTFEMGGVTSQETLLPVQR